MGMKSQREALASIKRRVKTVGGVDHEVWSVYLGTDRATHRKIQFDRASRNDLVSAVSSYYAGLRHGLTPDNSMTLSTRAFSDYQLARELLQEAGHGGVTMVEVARAFIAANADPVRSVPIGDALNAYLAQYSDVQIMHRRAVESRVGAFVQWIGRERPVRSVTVDDAKKYLSERYGDAAPKTWNNQMTYIKSFFSWCARGDNRFCKTNPMDEIQPKRIAHKDPEFVRADAVRTVFGLASSIPNEKRRNQCVWAFALSFFQGVRGEEIHRLVRSDVNLAEGWVRVSRPKGFQHGVAPRLVYLTDAAKAWMLAYPVDASGNPNALLLDALPLQDSALRTITGAAKTRGIPLDLPRNAGRHSFITMHVAMHGDPTKTEAIVGTSAQMRVSHYQGLATRREAEEYFNEVRPSA